MRNKNGRYELNQSPLYKLRRKSKLADLLRISSAELRHLAKNADELYSEFSIKKKDGGSRDVENPARQLKLAQARLARLLSKIQAPDYLFCPVKGRCYVSNAAQHRGHRVVHCLDVRKYFPSTSRKRVYWFFHSVMQCESDVAATIANIATFREYLPTGSPLSPIMAYFAHYDVWESINAICLDYDYTLTVYIDDVTISAEKIAPSVIWDIKRAIHKAGLRYHKQKSYYNYTAEITGVILSNIDMMVPNRQLRKISVAENQLTKATNEEDVLKLNMKLNGLNGQARQIVKASHQKTPKVRIVSAAKISPVLSGAGLGTVSMPGAATTPGAAR